MLRCLRPGGMHMSFPRSAVVSVLVAAAAVGCKTDRNTRGTRTTTYGSPVEGTSPNETQTRNTDTTTTPPAAGVGGGAAATGTTNTDTTTPPPVANTNTTNTTNTDT